MGRRGVLSDRGAVRQEHARVMIVELLGLAWFLELPEHSIGSAHIYLCVYIYTQEVIQR